jgi:hypothetical protein
MVENEILQQRSRNDLKLPIANFNFIFSSILAAPAHGV